MSRNDTIGQHKTNIFTKNGWTKVIYHTTCVICWNASQIILDSGGWQTNTTKARINQASQQFGLGIFLSQSQSSWFVKQDGEEKLLAFEDGMIIERKKRKEK